MMTTTTSASGTTFTVSSVTPRSYKSDTRPYRACIESLVAGPVEAYPFSGPQELVPVSYHGLLATIETSFSDHLPLVLSPDHIWLAICLGLSVHVRENAEALRSKFVTFDGKEKLIVRRDHFVKGSAENDWANVFPEFIEQMRVFLGDKADLMQPTFSTTGNVEIAACQITMMDAMQKYFDYEVHTMCGIPSVTLEGTVEDWVAIRNRVQKFAEFDLKWWTDPLEEMLQQFCEAAAGDPHQKWWQSFFKIDSMSGGDTVSGHVLNLFPYVIKKEYMEKQIGTRMIGNYEHPKYEHTTLKSYVRNEFLGKTSQPSDPNRWGDGINSGNFPSGLATAPFIWNYLSTEYQYHFISGFVGSTLDKATGAIRPEIGWAVRPVEG